jgi:hypothetical protein
MKIELQYRIDVAIKVAGETAERTKKPQFVVIDSKYDGAEYCTIRSSKPRKPVNYFLVTPTLGVSSHAN